MKSSTRTPAIGASPILSFVLSSRTVAQIVRVVTKVALRLTSIMSTLPSAMNDSSSESSIPCFGRLLANDKRLSAASRLGTMQPKDKNSKPADTKSLPEDILKNI